MSKIKNIINDIKQDKTKKTIATISLIVVCFFAFNLGGLLNKVLTSITSILSNETEIKTIEFTSDGYDTEEDGSFKVTKHADWTSTSTAQITWTMESYIEKDGVKKDIILVLDTSASMEINNEYDNRECTRLECSKSDVSELIKEVLSEEGNKFALITFNDDATILSNFTNDETTLLEIVSELQPDGDTNYNQALLKVGEILSTYTETEGREVEVLFITDGYPNIETPNQNATYEELKSKYPFITVHGIQYEMGEEVIVEIKRISDKQYTTNTDYLKNYLIEAAFSPEPYEVFEIVDYIDNDYFTIESEDDISVAVGDVTLTTENGVQKVTWTAPNEILTGNEYKLKINLKLKDEYVEVKGLYPTNTREVINIKLPGGDLVSFDTTEVPKLKAPYKVTYDANAPEGCSASIDLEQEHYAFHTVEFSSQTLECEGYQFKGWKTVEETTKVNDNSFIMPTEDVVVRGIWTKMDVVKSMEGKVYEKLSLYKTVAEQSVPDNITSEYVTSATGINFRNVSSNSNGKGVYTIASTLEDEYPIHYFRGDIDNNHVLFAGFCWEIVRTTETGGVKLIYDGTPVDGVCDNTGTDSQLSISNQFNSNASSLAYVGYMYNTIYSYIEKDYYKNLLSRRLEMTSTNYYYSNSISYDESRGLYTLTNPAQYTWEGNYSLLSKGYYTCFNETETSCSKIYYVVGADSSIAYYLLMEKGNLLDNVNYMIMSSSMIENGDGTYTLTEPVQVQKEEWFTNYNNYKGYYMCLDETSITCSSLHYISRAYNFRIAYVSTDYNYKYGNSFTYDETTGMYTLVDTVQFWDLHNKYKTLNNNHYTCFNSTGICSNIGYIYSIDDKSWRYIQLSDGKSINDALNEMLYAKDVNQKDSIVKKNVDQWYAENMVDYTKYLENTIYCNDRSAYALNGWDPNGGSPTSYLYFGGYGRRTTGKPVVECLNVADSFTLSIENGGTEGYGNNSLTYPVGLLSSDEVQYAGGLHHTNNSYYLYNEQNYWTMSPATFSPYHAGVFHAGNDGYLGNDAVTYSRNVRPVISLKHEVEYSRGNGTPESPYVIDLNSVE